MQEDAIFPTPTFARARLDAKGRRVPQCIGHRGYKAKYPENTMTAFRAAIAVGAQALETDVHVTKDDVVVLSHDGTLKRVFGREDKIVDKTWEEIRSAEALGGQQDKIAPLTELLAMLAKEHPDIWVLIDIKTDVDAGKLMRALGSTVTAHDTGTGNPWNERVVLGIWAANYLPLCQQYLPGYPVMHIGASTSYARSFFTIPQVGFNMLVAVLIGPGGASFLRHARKKYQREVIAWTVNEEDRMLWCIRQQLDGVITDDPKKYVEVREGYNERDEGGWLGVSLLSYFNAWRWTLWIMLMMPFFVGKRPLASPKLLRGKTA